MSIRTFAALLIGTAFITLTACEKPADPKLAYSSAIGNYYYNHPDCLWPSSQQFPTQAETSDHAQTMPFDALVDQGLLVRTTGEKKKFIIASKQVNNYDLSDKGRSVWTADESKPGFGNFCYGRRSVSSIDSSTPSTGAVGATTQVAYHYTLSGVPDWAKAPEVQNTYSQVQTDLAGPKSSTATLTQTNAGWQVTSVPTPPTSGNAASAADGQMVH